MSAVPPSPPRRRSSEALLVAVLLAAAVGGGLWLFRRTPESAQRPPQGTTVLDETVEVPAGGVSFRLRVPEPRTIEVALSPPAGVVVKVSLGPAQPPERSPVDVPDPESTTTWTARAGDPPHEHVTLVPGFYVLRLEPAGGSATSRVALRVRYKPDR